VSSSDCLVRKTIVQKREKVSNQEETSSRWPLYPCVCVCADLLNRYDVSGGGCLLDQLDDYARYSLPHQGLQFWARCHRTDETGLHRANGCCHLALVSVGSSDSILFLSYIGLYCWTRATSHDQGFWASIHFSRVAVFLSSFLVKKYYSSIDVTRCMVEESSQVVILQQSLIHLFICGLLSDDVRQKKHRVTGWIMNWKIY
jgi:hypothetical protein